MLLILLEWNNKARRIDDDGLGNWAYRYRYAITDQTKKRSDRFKLT